MIKLIVDTDIGSDCDDAGALAIMCVLADEGKCEILAVTHSLSRQSGPAAIDAIHRYYGHAEIPVGTLKKAGYFPANITQPYSDALQREYENAFPPGADCEDATALLRRQLAAQADNSVVMATIGPLSNIRFLLESPPDAVSPLCGRELLNRKVRRICCMGGYFSNDFGGREDTPVNGEFNIVSDILSAQIMVEQAQVPIVFIPWEAGAAVITGSRLLEQADSENPVYRSYELFCNQPRESWDLCTVLYAVYPEAPCWGLSPPGEVLIMDSGITLFQEKADGSHRILQVRDAAMAKKWLDAMLAAPPKYRCMPV